MSETLALYKLIILQMLQKIDFPLTNGQISEFILDKGYTNYFKLQQAIFEMVDTGFLYEEQAHNRTLYHLTDSGMETIQFFKSKIPPAILDDIDAFLREKKYDLKNEVSVKADYYKNNHQEYSVRCQVLENEIPLIDLTLTVPTEKEAITISTNWSTKNSEVYATVMSLLL